MKKLLLIFSIIGLIGCNNSEQHNADTTSNTPKKTQKDSLPNFAIAIHGGAGTILKENMSDSLEQAYRQKLEDAIKTGHQILSNGGTSLEAVQATIS